VLFRRDDRRRDDALLLRTDFVRFRHRFVTGLRTFPGGHGFRAGLRGNPNHPVRGIY
jgi:hypothetical protein